MAARMLKGIEWESAWNGRRGTLVSVLCPRCDHVSNVKTKSKVLRCANCAARFRRPKSSPQNRIRSDRKLPQKPGRIRRICQAVQSIAQIPFHNLSGRK